MQIQTCLLDADSTHSHDTVRYVWEGEQVRVTADITSTDLLRIEVKAHQVQPSCLHHKLFSRQIYLIEIYLIEIYQLS